MTIQTDGHDIDRHLDEALAEAEGIIGRYVTPESIGTDVLAPNHTVSLTDLVADKAQAKGINMNRPRARANATRNVQKVLRDRATDEMTRLDRVYLDLDGPTDQVWAARVPSIAYWALDDRDGALERHVGHPIEAAAVLFDPELAGRSPYVVRDVDFYLSDDITATTEVPLPKGESERWAPGDRIQLGERYPDPDTGMNRYDRFEVVKVYKSKLILNARVTAPLGTTCRKVAWKPNIWDERGYIGIVAVFDTITAADEAAEELRRAVRTVHRPVTDTAIAEDPVRQIGMPVDDEVDPFDSL